MKKKIERERGGWFLGEESLTKQKGERNREGLGKTKKTNQTNKH